MFVVVDTKPPHFSATLSRRVLVPLGYTVDDKTLVTWHSLEQLFDIHLIATARRHDADGARLQPQQDGLGRLAEVDLRRAASAIA